ncbi:DUF5819 family protein, partial [Anoxybacillus kestanbolensis]|uniref:DUF5819 family protein n=1 Tax=Anoxybacillus kestanbolensis TaxID=227476 RepID=UPI003D1B7B97
FCHGFRLSSFFLFHASMTLMYNFPINPFTVNHINFINSYINKLFTQNWRFFAPNPVNVDMNLVARGVYEDSKGRKKKTDWINITKTYSSKLQINRLDVNRLNLVALRTAISDVAQEVTKKEFYKNFKVNKNIDLFVIYNVSNDIISQIYNKKFDQIELRIVIDEFPEYGEKGETIKKYIYLPTESTDKIGDYSAK